MRSACVVLCFLSVSCAKATENARAIATDSATDACGIAPVSLEGSDDALEAMAIAEVGHRVRRDSLELWIRVGSDSTVIFRDSLDDSRDVEGIRRYRLRAWHRSLSAYEIEVGYYEGGATILVDARTGRQTLLWGPLVAAPHGSEFTSISWDMEAEYSPNGIQVWERRADTFALAAEFPLTEWGPSTPRWVSRDEVRVLGHPPLGAADTVVRCYAIRRVRGQWQVQPVLASDSSLIE